VAVDAGTSIASAMTLRAVHVGFDGAAAGGGGAGRATGCGGGDTGRGGGAGDEQAAISNMREPLIPSEVRGPTERRLVPRRRSV
jgi:hypothetical protein